MAHNGDRYDGEWFADQREGQGVVVYANGDRYEGEFYRNQVRFVRGGVRATAGCERSREGDATGMHVSTSMLT